MDINIILLSLRMRNHDHERNDTLKRFVQIGTVSNFTASNIVSILQTYTYDTYKKDCLMILKDKMEIVPENITNILGCYTHDTYKNDSLKILVSIIHIPFNHWKNILNRYTHDSYKEDAVKILYAQNPSVTIRLDELRSCFNHSQYFISMAKSVGFKDSELERYKNNDSASITFGPGNLYVAPGASVVMGNPYVSTGLVIDGNTNASELFSKLFPTMSKNAE